MQAKRNISPWHAKERWTIPSSQPKADSHPQAHQHGSVSSHLGTHHKHHPPRLALRISRCSHAQRRPPHKCPRTTDARPSQRRRQNNWIVSLTPSPPLPPSCPPAYATVYTDMVQGVVIVSRPPCSSLPLFVSGCLVVCTGRREFVEKRRHISIPALLVCVGLAENVLDRLVDCCGVCG